jgi:hypothetical protein
MKMKAWCAHFNIWNIETWSDITSLNVEKLCSFLISQLHVDQDCWHNAWFTTNCTMETF